MDMNSVQQVMHRYALAIDTKDWGALTDLFTENMSADFRTFGAKSVYEGSREGWVEQVRSTIAGMDATQHVMTNHLYEVDGAKATGTTYIQARHVCRNHWGGDVYTIGGHYAVDMVLSGDQWRIGAYTLHCTWYEGDRHVLKAAVRKAKG